MPIEISKVLIKKLPSHEKQDPEKALLGKSGGDCFLCARPMHESTEKLLADHDVPEAEGGETVLANLNLVHATCNSFKRNHPTVDVRPFLKLTSLIKEKGGFVKYDEAMTLLGVDPVPIDLVDNDETITVTLAGNAAANYPVFTEENKEGRFRFAFVSLSQNAVFNDDECQPRTIKPTHLWQIYNDICRNPLHEAPACRLEKLAKGVTSHRALLFDGQHKSLAFWIAGRDQIVAKVYIDITKDAAVRLVNSVQAKIKKLPLSPFELAAKMAEEWQERVDKYEQDVGIDNASEDGFIKWVEQDERTRARSAFADALYQSIIDIDELDFSRIVLRPGQRNGTGITITEAAFKNKVLKPLLHVAPLKEKFAESQKMRAREETTITRVLNLLYNKCFAPKESGELSTQDESRAKRLKYQSALNYVAGLMRDLIGYRMVSSNPRELLDKEPSPDKWTEIEEDIDRLLAHPIWTASFDQSDKTRAVKDALVKNQDAEGAFSNVGLKLGYVVGADRLPENILD